MSPFALVSAAVPSETAGLQCRIDCRYPFTVGTPSVLIRSGRDGWDEALSEDAVRPFGWVSHGRKRHAEADAPPPGITGRSRCLLRQ